MFKKIDTDETAMPKWLAAEDAQKRNTVNRKLYTEDEQKYVMELLSKVSQVYNARVFSNYREQFATVKVQKPNRMNLKSYGVMELNKWADAQGIDRVVTKSAVIYRVKH